MRVGSSALALVGVVSLCSSVVSAQTVLTLADVLTRARAHAPQIVSARLALEEARGRVAGASLRLPSNPDVDISVGNRQGSNQRSTDLQVGAAQLFEPPARRAARVAGAAAHLEQGVATVAVTTRHVLREAAIWFYQAVYATERIRLLTASEALAGAILHTADRRYRVGDLAVLDVNLARASLARVRSEREAGEAEHAAALGALRALLGVDGSVAVQGSLAPGRFARRRDARPVGGAAS